jgi:hypothetical protein
VEDTLPNQILVVAIHVCAILEAPSGGVDVVEKFHALFIGFGGTIELGPAH